jgi:hypothetical protein
VLARCATNWHTAASGRRLLVAPCHFYQWLFAGGTFTRAGLRLFAYLGETQQELALLRDKVPALLGLS